MTAVIVPFDRSPLTPDDEALMASVAAQLVRFGLVVERNTGPGFDGYRIRPSHTPLPRWVILRFRNGQYQLQDGIMGVLAKGPTLESVVFPGWRLSQPQADAAAMRGARAQPEPMADSCA